MVGDKSKEESSDKKPLVELQKSHASETIDTVNRPDLNRLIKSEMPP